MAIAHRNITYSISPIILYLSEEEASFLLTVTGGIAGDPLMSPRIHACDLRAALERINVKTIQDVKGVNYSDVYSGRIEFKSDEEVFKPGYFRDVDSDLWPPKLVFCEEDPGYGYKRVNVDPEKVKDV